MKQKTNFKKSKAEMTIATVLLILATLASVHYWRESVGDNDTRQTADVETQKVGRSSVQPDRTATAAQPASTRRAERRPPMDRSAVSSRSLTDNSISSSLPSEGGLEKRGPLPGETIYTMESVPSHKCGIYWVRSEDGSILQLACCTGHSDDEDVIAAHGGHGQPWEGGQSEGEGAADGK